ncbi:MAG: MFS transporter [Candidatus Aminicenantes bacterium]|nr:MFS transporter [Candidatus Aminicenantes bacterium]
MGVTDQHLSAGSQKYAGLLSSACGGMFVFGIVMAILGAVLPELTDKLLLNKAEAGNLFLYMNFAMLVMSLLFGPVVDRFGFKSFLIFCSLLVAVSFAVFSRVDSYSMVILAAAVLGFGGGGLNGGTNALTSDIRPEKRGPALNLLGIYFGFGALFIPFLIGTLFAKAGVSSVLLLAAIVSLIPFFLFLIVKFPRPKHPQGFPIQQAASVIRNPMLWLCSGLLFFQSGNEFTVGGWISTYLHENFGFTAAVASIFLAGYWGAIMAGRLVSSRILAKFGNEKVILFASIISLLAAALIRFSPDRFLSGAGAVLIGLGFAAVFPTTLAVIGENFPEFTGTAFSVAFVIALAGGMISPWITGKIAYAYTLRQGFSLPVFNCAVILIFSLFMLRSRRSQKNGNVLSKES